MKLTQIIENDASELVTDLEVGMDFREKRFRPEVWQQFYEFHLRYRAHPGCVYYLVPYLREKFGWDIEQTLWFVYLNGNTQNPIVSHMIMEKAPSVTDYKAAIEFWNDNYKQLEWDTDRRYHKKNFKLAVEDYQKKVAEAGTQKEYWFDAAERGFPGVWEKARGLYSFGRLSAFSFSEYLRIAGVPFDCDDLFLEDISGSRSHRNGLCVVAGQDHLVKFMNEDFGGKWEKDTIHWLKDYGAQLLDEAKKRAAGKDWEGDVSYFTLESALCTYKSWHKPNRRYANVYNDMFFNRIKRAEREHPDKDFSLWWQARKDNLPTHLRVEDVPNDPGLAREKQNHYLKTGQVVMMDREYPHFKNDFNDRVNNPDGDLLSMFS